MSARHAQRPRLVEVTSTNPMLAPVIDWVDRELANAYVMTGGKGGNTLLALRRFLSSSNLNTAIGGFYRLLPRLERNHFLLSFRIRRWFAMNFEVVVSDPLERVDSEIVSIRESDRAPGEFRTDFSVRSGGAVPIGDVRVRLVSRGTEVHEDRRKELA